MNDRKNTPASTALNNDTNDLRTDPYQNNSSNNPLPDNNFSTSPLQETPPSPSNKNSTSLTSAELKKIGEYIVKKTNELIQYSSNLDNEGKDTRQTSREMWHRYLQLFASQTRKKNDTGFNVQQVYDWKIDLSSDEPKKEFFEKIPGTFINLTCASDKGTRKDKFLVKGQPLRACEETAANAIKFNIGNCFEKNMLALILFRLYEPSNDLPKVEEKISVKVVYLHPQDIKRSHALIIINLKLEPEGSAIFKDPNTWNIDAVICAPWEKKVYTVEEARSLPDGSIWEDIINCKDKDDMTLEFEHWESYIGPKFNNDQPLSPEWNARVERLKKNDPNNKWWKKSANLNNLTRPPYEGESEALQKILYSKKQKK